MTESIRKQIADRIRDYDDAQGVALFAEVADCGRLEDVLRNRNVTEGCYVIKLDNAATDHTPYQRVIERYQVVTICQNYGDAYGTAVGEVAENMQQRVRSAISGYVVDDADAAADPLIFIAGGLVDLQNSLHVWADIYQTEYTHKI